MINCKACNKPVESSFIAKAGVYWHLGCEDKEPVWDNKSTFIADLVALRTNQKLYFKTRGKDYLRESIRLEKQVDEWLTYFKPCPKCNDYNYADPCFQLVKCDFCDYCIHASSSGGKCDACGKETK